MEPELRSIPAAKITIVEPDGNQCNDAHLQGQVRQIAWVQKPFCCQRYDQRDNHHGGKRADELGIEDPPHA